MANIITLSEYKGLMGVQTGDTRDDTQITALLSAASRAVRMYTGRSFEVNTGLSTDRTFQYDGSGYLDIDDCTSVSTITTDGGVPGQTFTLDAVDWTIMPQDDSDVFYYLILNGGPFGMSPEMGFTRNLDTIGLTPRDPMVTVTATWGWPAIPDDVKLATALTIAELKSSSGPGKSEGLSSEAIEGWSRSWGGRTSGMTALAVPNRARDLLVGYQRVFV